MKSIIIAPVHKQPKKRWVEALKGKEVLIIDDSNGKVDLPFECFDYEAQKEELGNKYEIFDKYFHKDSACKIFGLWMAWKRGYDVMMVLDSDCIIGGDFEERHLNALKTQGTGWVNPLKDIGWFSRGYPYSERNKRVVCNMGLWTGELDINGKDRLDFSDPDHPGWEGTRIAHGMIPFGMMNFAVRRDAVPAFILIPDFSYKTLDFARHDDIFGGYIFEKIIRMAGDVMSYGLPFVEHTGTLNPDSDAEQEEAMILTEDTFYKMVDDIFRETRGCSYKEIYADFADRASYFKDTMFEPIIEPIRFLRDLYE